MSSPGKGKIRLLRILTGLNVFSQNPVACGFNVSGGGDGAMEMVRVVGCVDAVVTGLAVMVVVVL